MATNPFEIEPLGGADIGGTLVGIGGLMQRKQQMEADASEREAEESRRVAKEQQTAQAKKAVADAYRSGDPNQIAEAMATYPEMQKALAGAVGFRNEATKNNMLTSAREILQNPDKAEDILRGRVAFVESQGGDATQTKAELAKLVDDREGFLSATRDTYAGLAPKQEWEAYAKRAGIGPKAQGLASAKTEILDDGTIIQALPNQEVIVRNRAGDIVTGQDRLDALDRSNQFREERRQREATRKVETARRVAAATGREGRISEKRKELSQRNTNAARNQVKVRQALQTAANATQGVRGSAKMALAKIFPDIDVTNEALLDQSLQQLAIEQLSNFKGPTTDFEFEKVESATGALGDPKTANIARLKALQRNNWFMRREAAQFKDYVKQGGDPDEFAFDFEEPIKIKGGNKEISLMDLQETAAANNMTIEETLKALNR